MLFRYCTIMLTTLVFNANAMEVHDFMPPPSDLPREIWVKITNELVNNLNKIVEEENSKSIFYVQEKYTENVNQENNRSIDAFDDILALAQTCCWFYDLLNEPLFRVILDTEKDRISLKNYQAYLNENKTQGIPILPYLSVQAIYPVNKAVLKDYRQLVQIKQNLNHLDEIYEIVEQSEKSLLLENDLAQGIKNNAKNLLIQICRTLPLNISVDPELFTFFNFKLCKFKIPTLYISNTRVRSFLQNHFVKGAIWTVGICSLTGLAFYVMEGGPEAYAQGQADEFQKLLNQLENQNSTIHLDYTTNGFTRAQRICDNVKNLVTNGEATSSLTNIINRYANAWNFNGPRLAEEILDVILKKISGTNYWCHKNFDNTSMTCACVYMPQYDSDKRALHDTNNYIENERCVELIKGTAQLASINSLYETNRDVYLAYSVSSVVFFGFWIWMCIVTHL